MPLSSGDPATNTPLSSVASMALPGDLMSRVTDDSVMGDRVTTALAGGRGGVPVLTRVTPAVDVELGTDEAALMRTPCTASDTSVPAEAPLALLLP